jgi:hypothetical protein
VDLCSSTHSCIKKKKKEKAKQKPAKEREKGETKENGNKSLDKQYSSLYI